MLDVKMLKEILQIFSQDFEKLSLSPPDETLDSIQGFTLWLKKSVSQNQLASSLNEIFFKILKYAISKNKPWEDFFKLMANESQSAEFFSQIAKLFFNQLNESRALINPASSVFNWLLKTYNNHDWFYEVYNQGGPLQNIVQEIYKSSLNFNVDIDTLPNQSQGIQQYGIDLMRDAVRFFVKTDTDVLKYKLKSAQPYLKLLAIMEFDPLNAVETIDLLSDKEIQKCTSSKHNATFAIEALSKASPEQQPRIMSNFKWIELRQKLSDRFIEHEGPRRGSIHASQLSQPLPSIRTLFDFNNASLGESYYRPSTVQADSTYLFLQDQYVENMQRTAFNQNSETPFRKNKRQKTAPSDENNYK